MNDIDGLIHELQRHLRAEQMITDADTLHTTSIDGLEPRLIVLPETVEQVSQVVALTNQHNLTLLPHGGGIRMSLGVLPERFDVLLDTRRLSRLLDHQPEQHTCRVQAGMLLSTLQEHLAKKGQRLPLDPVDAMQTTIGGLLATNVRGRLTLRYGTARELATTITVVQADGTLTEGIDSIGALGASGIIVEAVLKLDDIPETARTLFLTYANVTDAMETVFSLLRSPLLPSAMELIDAGAASDLSNFFGISMPINGYSLALLIEGTNNIVEQHMSDIKEVARTHNAFLTDDLEDGQQRTFWNALRNHTQGTVTCSVTLPPEKVVSFLHDLASTCARYTLDSALTAHAGNGILTIELRPGDATPRLIEAIAALHVLADAIQGTLIVEQCPVDLRRRMMAQMIQDTWPGLGAIQQQAQRIDPKGTFARGKALRSL